MLFDEVTKVTLSNKELSQLFITLLNNHLALNILEALTLIFLVNVCFEILNVSRDTESISSFVFRNFQKISLKPDGLLFLF